MTDAGSTQDNFILPAPPVGGLPLSQDWLDRMKLVHDRYDMISGDIKTSVDGYQRLAFVVRDTCKYFVVIIMVMLLSMVMMMTMMMMMMISFQVLSNRHNKVCKYLISL